MGKPDQLMGAAWAVRALLEAGEMVLLLLTVGYAGVVLFLTSRRAWISRSTLAIGTGAGLLLGVVMYAVAPLGLSNYATNPSG